jgi:hypothetical protein
MARCLALPERPEGHFSGSPLGAGRGSKPGGYSLWLPAFCPSQPPPLQPRSGLPAAATTSACAAPLCQTLRSSALVCRATKARSVPAAVRLWVVARKRKLADRQNEGPAGLVGRPVRAAAYLSAALITCTRRFSAAKGLAGSFSCLVPYPTVTRLPGSILYFSERNCFTASARRSDRP